LYFYILAAEVGDIPARVGHHCQLLLRWPGKGPATHGHHANGQGDKLSPKQRVTVSL